MFNLQQVVFNTYAASVFWECPTCAAMATAAVAPAPIMQVVVDPIRIAPIGNLNLGAQPTLGASSDDL